MKYVELKDVLIGIWNVRSLYRAGHMTTVTSYLEQCRLDIAAIQDTRWPNRETLRQAIGPSFYNDGLDQKAGVGFFVSDKLLLNV